ncbi:protein of unknown function (plasmid) [Caballeronia sp. S22]
MKSQQQFDHWDGVSTSRENANFCSLVERRVSVVRVIEYGEHRRAAQLRKTFPLPVSIFSIQFGLCVPVLPITRV